MKKYGCSDNRGYFDDASREYVITDMYPIRPWLNYLWSEQTVASVDQFGFGKSLAGIDGSRRKIDDGERLIYIKDNISGNFYSPNRNYGKLPMDDFRCVVGQGYQKIVSEYEGLRTTFTILVPSSGYAVLYHAEIEELRGKDRDLTIYFAVRPQANLTEHTSYGFADFDPKYQGLCFPHFAYQSPTDYSCLYFSSERKFKSYSVSKRDFCGTYGDWSAPESLSAKKLSSRGSTFEEEYAAVVEIPIKLRPHGKKMFAFSLAAGRSLEESGALASSLAKESVFRSELKKQCAYGKACERVFRAEMPDPFFQSLTNIWLKRQLSLGKSWGVSTEKVFATSCRISRRLCRWMCLWRGREF